MYWIQSAACGALGGGVIEVLVFYRRLSAWQVARHRALEKSEGLPHLRVFIDPAADIAAGLTRIALGALAGWLFHWEVTGIYAAVAVGAAAPVLLSQVGSAQKSHQLALHDGTTGTFPPAGEVVQSESSEIADGM